MADKIGERRANPRRATIRAAVSMLDGPQSPIECVVLDVSKGGARLLVHRRDELLSDFILHIEEFAMTQRCRVIWRREDEVGVEFTD